jgi:acetyltransferase
MADIRRMFDPKTIALIGASEEENSTGRDLLRNLLSTGGRERTIYPVNPNRKSVLNLECFPNVLALPRAVDLAVIVSPASTVPPGGRRMRPRRRARRANRVRWLQRSWTRGGEA